MFAQGGMGTEYASDSIFSNPGMMAASPNLVNRSELSVGRFILPLVVDYGPKLKVGYSFDVVWAAESVCHTTRKGDFLKLADSPDWDMFLNLFCQLSRGETHGGNIKGVAVDKSFWLSFH